MSAGFGRRTLHAFSCIVLATSIIWSIDRVAAETPRERGRYIVNVLAACAGCHTPQISGEAGPPLSGGKRFGPPGSSVASANITPDKATGIGTWTDRQVIDAIRRGIRPDGTLIRPPMPQQAYRAISDGDAAAVVDYLRSVPPTSHLIGSSTAQRTPARDAPTPVDHFAQAATTERRRQGSIEAVISP